MARVKRNPETRKRSAQGRALRRYDRPYERLKAKLRDLGYVCVGSITRRWLTCGKPSCACHRHQARRHGPYYYWTRKIAERTESRMLDESIIHLYKEGIRNHRNLDTLIKKMREVSLSAFDAAKMASNR
mgnify:CR=1 FL=1